MSEPEDRPISGSSRSVVDAANPWPGLEAFWEADRDFFHGRHAEATELRRRVMRRKLTLLFSPSGLGKTSLLRAGLFPQLRAKNVLPVYIRLDFTPENPRFTAQILDEVVSQIRRAGGEAPEPLAGDTLWEYFQRKGAEFWNHRNRPCLPLLAIDQFEEIFTRGKRDATRDAACLALIEELMQLVEGRPPAHLSAQFEEVPERVRDFEFGFEGCKLLIGMREDYLPHFEELPLAPLAFDRWRLRAMDGNSAMEVASQAPELIDGAVAEGVVRFVAGPRQKEAPLAELEVDPAILSVMLRELNERRRSLGEAKITGDLLEGTKDALLAGFYERNVANLPAEMRLLIEEELLTVSGDRDNIAYDNALTLPGVTERAIEQLVENRLVRIEERAGSRRLELTHDLLTGVIVASRDDRRLREAEEQERRARVAAEEEAREARLKLRRSRILTALFVALFLLALLSAGWAYWSQDKAQMAESAAKTALAQKETERQRAEHAFQVSGLALADSDAARKKEQEARAATLDALAKAEAARELASTSQAATEKALGNHYYREALRLSQGGDRLKSLPFFAKAIALAPGNAAARAHTIATLLRIGGPAANLEFHHDSAMVVAEFSPDGQRVVAGGADGKVFIWDAASGEPLGRPFNTGSKPYEAKISPDGRRLLIANSRNAQVWDIVSRTPINLLHPGPVTSAEFSPDGKTILTYSSAGKSVKLWALDGLQLGEIEAHSAGISMATFSPDGRFIVTASADKTAAVWSSATGESIRKLEGHKATVNTASFSPDGLRVLTASADGMLKIWDLEASQGAILERRYTSGVLSAWFNQDGSKIVAVVGKAASEHSVRIIHLGSPVTEKIITPSGSPGITSAEFSQDGSKVLTATSSHQAQAWFTATGEPVGPPLQHGVYLGSAEFSPDGNRIVTAAWDGTTRIQSLFAANPVGEPLKTLSDPIQGSKLVLLDNSRTVAVQDRATGKFIGATINLKEPVTYSTFCGDSRWILLRSADGLRLWNSKSGFSFTIGFKDPWGEPPRCVLHEDLIAVFGARIAAVFDIINHKQTGPGYDSGGFIFSLAFSPDGKRLAITTQSGLARVWNIGSLKPLAEISAAAENVPFDPIFGSNGSLLATVAQGNIKIWDAEVGVLLAPPLALPAGSTVGKFSANGQQLLTASRSWDFPTYSDGEALELAKLAEFVANLRVGSNAQIEELPGAERSRRLAELRELASKAPDNEPTVASFIKWFFTPRFERTISPLSKMTVEQYITEMLAIGTPEARREAEENFPGHPLLMVGPQSAKP